MLNAMTREGVGIDARGDVPALNALDQKQVGSIRHIGNLARQLKGDWSNMMGPTPLQEDFGAYKFQLAYGLYALGLAHFHRLPAAPGMFKTTFELLIEKMLHPEVWFDWRDISKGGGFANIDAPVTEGWVDPVVKDNIMYSAYLQTMPLFYNVLFGDDRYTRPGALTLQFNPLGWGGQKGFKFEYDQNSLNERVYWNMVENGYLGVACEPHCVFQICNQPPILGFRLHDVLNGGSTAEEVTQGYLKAWQDYGGLLDENGSYNMLYQTYSKILVPAPAAVADAWCGTLMHAWNPDFVKQNYERQRDRWLVRCEDGLLSVKLCPPIFPPERMPPGGSCDLALMACWASEVGDVETLNGLLAHADRYMRPRFVNGGYTYPRNDTLYDAKGNLIINHPSQSNALFPYARLNVPNGLHLLYSQPWDREHFTEPALTEVDFSIDILRAFYDGEDSTLTFDAALFDKEQGGSILISRMFDRGNWILMRGGKKVAWGDSRKLIASEESGIRQEDSALRLDIGHTAPASYEMRWSR
jgi:hypothetical protein